MQSGTKYPCSKKVLPSKKIWYYRYRYRGIYIRSTYHHYITMLTHMFWIYGMYHQKLITFVDFDNSFSIYIKLFLALTTISKSFLFGIFLVILIFEPHLLIQSCQAHPQPLVGHKFLSTGKFSPLIVTLTLCLGCSGWICEIIFLYL